MIYFYFMAIIGPGGARSESFGTVTLTSDTTRKSVYHELRAKAQAGFGCEPHQIAVTAFTLEPDALTA